MKNQDVQVGRFYAAKVSGKLVALQILRANPRGGWDAFNPASGRDVRVRTAARLRFPVRPIVPKEVNQIVAE